MPENYPGSTPGVEFYTTAFAAAQTDDERTALFYAMLGDYGRRGEEVTAAYDLAASVEATEAIPAPMPDEDPELREELDGLRQKVAELTGQLTTAGETNKKLGIAKRSAEDRAELAEAKAALTNRINERTIRRLSGKVRVLQRHVCGVDGVPNLHYIGVAGTARVFAHNSVPERALNLWLIRQGTDEHGMDRVAIRYMVMPSVTGGDEEFATEPAGTPYVPPEVSDQDSEDDAEKQQGGK